MKMVFWSLALEQPSAYWLHVLHLGADELMPESSYENMLMQGDQTQMKPNWHGDV